MMSEDAIEISRTEYHELKGIIGRLQIREAELWKENQRLREALEYAIQNCPTCNGTTQPWYTLRADCYCKPMREALAKLQNTSREQTTCKGELR